MQRRLVVAALMVAAVACADPVGPIGRNIVRTVVSGRTLTFVSIGSSDGGTCGAGPQGGAYCWGGVPRYEASLYKGSSFIGPCALVGGRPSCRQVADTFGSGEYYTGGRMPEDTNHYVQLVGAGGRQPSSYSPSYWALKANGRVFMAANGPNGFELVQWKDTARYVQISTQCGRTKDGRVYCDPGHSGGGTEQGALVPGGHHFTQITGRNGIEDGFSQCGIEGGYAYCWGANDQGELGTGDFDNRVLPTRVKVVSNVVHLALSVVHACAVQADGRAFCWGYNNNGQLGNGTFTDNNSVDNDWGDPFWSPSFQGNPTPTLVKGGLVFTQLSLGRVFSCGLANGGKAYCWGSGYSVGQADTIHRSVPVPIAKLP